MDQLPRDKWPRGSFWFKDGETRRVTFMPWGTGTACNAFVCYEAHGKPGTSGAGRYSCSMRAWELWAVGAVREYQDAETATNTDTQETP